MPNLIWSKLTHLQLGTYAEYYAKMEFASYGYEVYTSEVDDHGIDFIAKDPSQSAYFEVQVKSKRNMGYVFQSEKKMPLGKTRLLCLLTFTDGKLPDIYIIPSLAWQKPSSLLVYHDYDKENPKGSSEWGINLSKKNLPELEQYRSDLFFNK